jgi:hypothetical protein
VGLERGPLSLESTIEELLGRNSSDSGLENREYGLGICCVDRATPSIRKSWPSFGIVCSRTKTTEFVVRYAITLELGCSSLPLSILTGLGPPFPSV